MAESNEFQFCILGAIYTYLAAFTFWLLSINSRLLITLAVSVILLVLSIFIAMLLFRKKQLSILKSFIICLVVVFFTIFSYFAETHFISFNKIILIDEHIHLGDKQLEWFKPSEPLPESFIMKEFNIPIYPKIAKIKILAKDIDPDFRSGPVLLLINKTPIGFLNNAYPFCDMAVEEEHKGGFQWAELKIDAGYLNKGNNNFSIFILPTVYGFDDINISKAELFYK